jgi:L-threonylcarbamoyladenylate synthase
MQLEPYLSLLRRGGVVACATETLFGLLADALNEQAVARVSAIKRRRPDDPVAVLVPSLQAAEELVAEFSGPARQLAGRYWPGPLTLVMRARVDLPAALTRHGKIGIRVPGDSPALDLVRAFGGALTATSANRTSEPAAVTAEQVRASLGGEVDAVVPGAAPGGPPSTVLDVTRQPPLVLRAGAVSFD